MGGLVPARWPWTLLLGARPHGRVAATGGGGPGTELFGPGENIGHAGPHRQHLGQVHGAP